MSTPGNDQQPIAGAVPDGRPVAGRPADPPSGPSAGPAAGPSAGLSADRPAGPPADTVARAMETPDVKLPYIELGMNDEEFARVHRILGRRPTSAELAIYSVMWSEHCSYKSSRVHLKKFAEKAPRSDALLVGMGENAGVVDVGNGWAVTFKIESHNHPSYVEPYQGAATGVGGIVRDILSMGARPVAVMDSLRFGAPDAARHPPRAGRRRTRRGRLRQLPRPAQHRRRGRLRPLLRREPAGQRALRGRAQA